MAKEKTDEQLAEANKHIETPTILQDIADTQSDIVQWRREEQGYRLIGDKMSLFRADARIGYIGEGSDFIEKLLRILEVRRRSTLAQEGSDE